MFGATAVCRDKHRLQPCEPKPRPAEARRIYKSPFLTGLAPRASAREHLRHRSTASDKKPVPVSLPNQNRKPAAARVQRCAPETTIFLHKPTAPLRRQRTAESANHADANHDPHHSGCEVAGSEDKTKIIHTENRPNRMAPESGPKPECKERQGMTGAETERRGGVGWGRVGWGRVGWGRVGWGGRTRDKTRRETPQKRPERS